VLGREERVAGEGNGRAGGGGKKNVGPAWGFRLKEFFFPFARDSNKFNLNSKFEEFKFKLNHNIKTMQG
jgi:hypothetical protein